MLNDKQQQSQSAKNYIIKNRKALIKKFVGDKSILPDPNPVSLFMAGSPGAGKTEVSKRLIEQFNTKPVRIDADEIREFCPDYSGANAHIFQDAATKGVHILYDYALAKKLNLILDGTFAYSKAVENVSRSLEKDRKVIIYYLYQDPKIAWEYTQKREALEHRKVSKEIFIAAFVNSRLNINETKRSFGDRVELNLVINNFNANFEKIILNIDNVDQYLPTVYDVDNLSNFLLV